MLLCMAGRYMMRQLLLSRIRLHMSASLFALALMLAIL